MSTTETTSILDQILEPVGRVMTTEFARDLVGLRVGAEVQAHIDALAEKCNEGQITDDERAEYKSYVQAIHVIGILQRKATGFLADGMGPA